MDKELLKARLGHSGRIFFNLSIAGGVLSLLCLLSPFITALYMFIVCFVLIIGVVFTLGLIFLAYPQFVDRIMGAASDATQITLLILKVIDYSLPIMTITAAIATVLLFASGRYKQAAIASCIIAVVGAIVWALVSGGVVKVI
ncbi:MAG: hypothetical protein ACI4MI_05805 [Christensenellales bacterium]